MRDPGKMAIEPPPNLTWPEIGAYVGGAIAGLYALLRGLSRPSEAKPTLAVRGALVSDAAVQDFIEAMNRNTAALDRLTDMRNSEAERERRKAELEGMAEDVFNRLLRELEAKKGR